MAIETFLVKKSTKFCTVFTRKWFKNKSPRFLWRPLSFSRRSLFRLSFKIDFSYLLPIMSWDEAAFKKAKMSSAAPDFDSKKVLVVVEWRTQIIIWIVPYTIFERSSTKLRVLPWTCSVPFCRLPLWLSSKIRRKLSMYWSFFIPMQN